MAPWCGVVVGSRLTDMKIAVLGASGGTGRCILAAARQRGHLARAVVRRQVSLPEGGAEPDMVIADALDLPSVTRAVGGCDAAVWAVGGHDVLRTTLSGKPRQRALCTDGTRVLLSALRDRDVARLVVISSWGVGDSRRRLPLTFRLFVAPLLLRAELADKQRQEELVRSSDRMWTIVRPSRLTDRHGDNRSEVGSQLRYAAASSTSREQVADFVVRCLDEAAYIHETVEISGWGGSS